MAAALNPAPRKPVRLVPAPGEESQDPPARLALGEGRGAATCAGYLSPLSALSFDLICPGTEN